MPDQAAYAPLNVPKAVAEDIWVVDGAPIHAGPLTLPIRMTIIRLADGDLLVHSPIQYTAELRQALEELGPIRHLIAPSVGHWMFLPAWQDACAGATTWAVPGLRQRSQVREAGVRIDAELAGGAPDQWGGAIEVLLVRGPGYAEAEFFHRPSRTLVLTDLVLNLETQRLPAGSGLLAHLLGIAAPHGKAPLYLRLLLKLNRREVARTAARLVGFAPEHVIFTHGRWFDRDATARLRQALSWALGPTKRSGPMRPRRGVGGETVVITGASSGIGRAAALAFARQGARIVLAARRRDVLEDVVRECTALGAQAIAVPTDVTDPDAVERLAEAAQAAFGGVDVWINNAGTGVFGPYQDADIQLHRRTVEVNLLGTMHGAWAVLPIFLRQGHGVLINNISLGGWAPTPFAAAYTASKFGLRGFTASLRQELARHPRIHVCGVFPAMVDTPGFVHGANMSGRQLDPGPLLYRSEDVAETFVRLARRPRAEIAVGWPARLGQAAYALAPRPTEYLIGAAIRGALAKSNPAPRREGSMLAPIPDGTDPSGGWLDRKNLPSAGKVSAGLAVAGLVGALGAFAILARARRDRKRA